MNQLIIVLITALLTALGTSATIWLGSRLTRENEDRKWRRDRALEAYSEILGAVEMVRFEADAAYIRDECETEEHGKQHIIVLEKVAELNRIQERAFLVAPDEVNAHLAALTSHVATEIGAKLSKCPKIEESERNTAMEKYNLLLGIFTRVARNDLDVHPPLNRNQIPKKPWWRFWQR